MGDPPRDQVLWERKTQVSNRVLTETHGKWGGSFNVLVIGAHKELIRLPTWQAQLDVSIPFVPGW